MPSWSAPLYVFNVLLCLFIYIVIQYRAGPYGRKPGLVIVAALVLGAPALGVAAALLAQAAVAHSRPPTDLSRASDYQNHEEKSIMAKEIERKYTVDAKAVADLIERKFYEGKREISQYYIVATMELAIRLRKDEGDDHAVLAVKSGGNALAVDEYEFATPLSEYEAKKAEMVGIEINKTRYEIPFEGLVWELDVFHGDLDGLIVAEVELKDADAVVKLPVWAATEVTFDPSYKNAVLALKGLPTA
jgi:CYTH domain-containing protein